jgi:hypothetical protein
MDNSLVIYDHKADEFWNRAMDLLSERDVSKLKEYIDAGRYQISPDTVMAFFELYLNGNEPIEIARLNQGFSLDQINWAMVKYNWPAQRDQHLFNLQNNIRDKVIKAQLEATSLITDMITVSNKKNSEKLKKYIQTGDEEYLKGVMNIESLNGLLKTIEGLQKITGQDRTTIIKTQQTTDLNLNINQKGSSDMPNTIGAEDAAAILAIYAKGKRSE